MVQDHNDPSNRESSVTDVSSPPVTNGDDGIVGENGGIGGGEESVLAGEDDESMAGDGNGSKDSLRRTSSKIANLRLAFEKQNDGTSPNGKSVFERSPARSRDRGGDMTKLKEQHEAEIAKIKAQQEVEVARLKEQHQSETVNLKRQLGTEVEMRQAFEDKCTGLEEQIEALQAQVARKGNEHESELERRTTTLQQEKVKAQEDANNLQKQLYELKRGISTSTRIDNEVSDSSFTQQFQNLYHETQNWVVNNYRKIKVEKTSEEICALLQNIAEPKQLENLEPIFRKFDSSIKLAAFQATAVCYMMEIFNEPLLFGLPSQQDWRRSIKKAAETLPAVLSPASYNKWRSVTTDALRQSESEEIKTSLESAAKSMAEMICITLNTLSDAEDSAARVTSLQAILKRTVSLSHLFRIQRARYEFDLPTPGSTFMPGKMEDASVADGAASSERMVRCSTFPGVVKIGDENGENGEVRHIVMKAMVVCSG
ncbi:hypothetical protein M409DRAFT_17236 [Zasmidium cellare ATCC 36951]|uniref:Uncharacterized protein n=1 Tax=Zasmidium cellare ATCC 36951 TaxID=1080233 RepID=A0A6A6D1J1_ZASCE|nr:uncharacterized protein M409DRAFT_17236 [Zasmidium cellare ATCC 36951]KAF2173294.1 hypothetical protein M409DRAFT_17236 [Zasmidium cellare ATCC 36951]